MSKLSRPISKLTRKFFPIKSFFGAYVAGLAWGLLPCGMVYMAFAMSLGAENAMTAPLVMLFFGLGTLPMMLTLSISGNFFGGFFSSKNARRVAGGIVLLMTLFYMGSMLMKDLGGGMNHGTMDHSQMSAASMDHSKMDMPVVDHSQMDHSKMDMPATDNKPMNDSQVDHSKMQH